MDEPIDHLRTYIIVFVAEFFGTAFLMYLGCLGLSTARVHSPGVEHLQGALVWGSVITTVIMMFGHISRGHFNPAVTLCAIILRIITPLKSIVYFVADMLGATFGYWLLTISLPRVYLVPKDDNGTYFCNTRITHSEMTPLRGVLAEFIATSVLIFSVCSAWDPRNTIWSDSVAIKFGFVVMGLAFAVGPLTGASLNPARSFGPALVNGVWTHHWIYWVAPLGASLVTTLMYKYLYLPDASHHLRTNEKLSDQFRQGSLYSKGEDTESLVPKKTFTMPEIK